MSAAETPTITGWDCEGHPMWNKDEVEQRLDDYMDSLGKDDHTWSHLDSAIGGIFYDGDLVDAEALLPILTDLLDLQRRRLEVEMLAREDPMVG